MCWGNETDKQENSHQNHQRYKNKAKKKKNPRTFIQPGPHHSIIPIDGHRKTESVLKAQRRRQSGLELPVVPS